ncbi:MAG: hypothetical protein HFH36_08270 [Lachnospiraceae bacterium]|nr:hypothetical protein [Lachnospiraceae bacterium]
MFYEKKNALIHGFGHFMTVLKELPFSLVYYPMVNKFILERKQEAMKHLLKGAAVAAVVLIALMIINMFCNMHDIHLDQTATGTISAVCAMLFYRGLIRNEQNKDDRNEK